MNGEDITAHTTGSSTGDWTKFDSLTIENVYLEEGKHVLTYHVDNDIPLNISHINFKAMYYTNISPLLLSLGLLLKIKNQ